ncbi:hypothetical protein [Novosphingobium aerophilum]|uniref:hypothetical protein n=1 Tax=Novosphingobium aerophilum TaxID=2839843 RepID=UPI003FD1FEF5
MRSSAIRARLASFQNAYVVALRLRAQTGAAQYIVRTENPLHPVMVTSQWPRDGEILLAEIH